MKLTLAFDIYGTLIDTQAVVMQLEKLVGEDANEFSQLWRSKQLEYSFRRALMKRYKDFSVCIADSLEYCCSYFDISLSKAQKQALLDQYRALPKFEDVSDALTQLKALNYRTYAFSNGSKKTVTGLLESAGIIGLFDGVISVEEVQSFKPNPSVYESFLKQTGSLRENTWLISSNSFDVIGASSAGLKSVWVQRDNKNVYDPWGIEQTITISSLQEMVPVLSDFNELR